MKSIIVKAAILTMFVLPVSANAFFLKSMVEGMTSVANNMVDGATEVSTDMLDLFGALADDIGEMADRILDMADKIGEMADRIVATEQLMANMVVDLAEIKSGNTASGTSTTANSVFITAVGGTTLGYWDRPQFDISKTTPEYLVYVSASLSFTTNTISVLVHNNEELADMWNDLNDVRTSSKIYIAVKTIENNTISSLSNVLTYTQY
jgi:hypothetical protein